MLLSPFVLMTSTKTPEKIVYDVVKSIYNDKTRLVEVHKSFNSFDPAKMHIDIGVPYHPGALKFYKEHGI